LGTPGGGLAGKGLNTNLLGQINNGLIPASFIPGNNNEPPTTVPKAYINYMFFDEQFQFVSGGFSRVGNSGTLKRHWFEDAGLQNITVPKNGYIFVYVSNESNLNVFFDNVQVIHKPGALLEETHYYPFGLTMAGISSKAAGKLENKFKFNDGTELTSDFDLSLYETPHRGYDPQIGRFWQIDEFGEVFEEWSPYVFSLNNPISLNDPAGLTPNDPLPKEPPKDAPAETLQNVTVVGIRKTGDVNHGISLYYAMMKKTGGDLSQIVNDQFRNEMYRYQALAEFRNQVNSMTRATDEVAVELGSYFMPMGWLTKLAKLKHLQRLYSFRRGIPMVSKAETAAAKGGGQGGLNLFKWGAEQTGKSSGWKAGDYMLHLPNKGTPKLNWKANYGALRREMGLGNPIYDSYRLPNGNLIPTGGFLNAERFTLQSRGWIYNPSQGAWLPPIK
jgi:RHS repeat-associated protein